MLKTISTFNLNKRKDCQFSEIFRKMKYLYPFFSLFLSSNRFRYSCFPFSATLRIVLSFLFLFPFLSFIFSSSLSFLVFYLFFSFNLYSPLPIILILPFLSFTISSPLSFLHLYILFSFIFYFPLSIILLYPVFSFLLSSSLSFLCFHYFSSFILLPFFCFILNAFYPWVKFLFILLIFRIFLQYFVLFSEYFVFFFEYLIFSLSVLSPIFWIYLQYFGIMFNILNLSPIF